MELGSWSWTALSAGIFSGIVANWIWSSYKTIIPSFASKNSQSVSGVWLAKVQYTNVPGREGLEVLRFQESFGNVSIYKEHYNSNHILPVRLTGKGIFRGGMMSAYLYQDEENSYASMTMTFKQESSDFGPAVLIGVYTQIIDRRGEEKGPLMEPYNLVRIDLPLWRQLKRFMGRTYFENFGDIKAFCDLLPDQRKKYL